MSRFKKIMNMNLTGPNKGEQKEPLAKDEKRQKRSRKTARRPSRPLDLDVLKVIFVLFGIVILCGFIGLVFFFSSMILILVLGGILGCIFLINGYRVARKRRRIALFKAIRMIVNNNAPLGFGFHTLADDAPSYYLRSKLRQMGDTIQNGYSLSETLECFPKDFFAPHVDLIGIAEVNGRLVPVIDDIIHDLEMGRQHSNTVTNNMSYIIFNVTVQTLILFFLLVKVVPVFAEIFQEFGAGLPNPTQLLVDVSESIKFHTTEIFFLFVILANVSLLFWLSPRFRRFMTGFTLPIPFFGKLVRFKQRLLIIEALEANLKAQLPLPQALERMADMHISSPYRRAMKRMHTKLSSGCSVKESFSRNTFLMGNTFASMMALGESSGTLGESCTRLKELYRSEITYRGTLIVDAMIPAYAVIGGALNFWIISSLYITIWSLSDILFYSM